MSGLGEMGQLPAFVNGGGGQVTPVEMDEYQTLAIDTPSVDSAYYGAGTVAGTAVTAIVLKNQLVDYPRNLAYCFTGGTSGGTIVANLIDQFGVPKTETVALGSIAGGGTTFGTAIAMKFLSGTVFPNTSTTGTYTVGNGTTSGTAGNYFGLLTKIDGTADVKNIVWITTSTPTGMNKGTAIGTLVNPTTHSFQGTSGVAATDHYRVTFKPTWSNLGKPKMSNL